MQIQHGPLLNAVYSIVTRRLMRVSQAGQEDASPRASGRSVHQTLPRSPNRKTLACQWHFILDPCCNGRCTARQSHENPYRCQANTIRICQGPRKDHVVHCARALAGATKAIIQHLSSSSWMANTHGPGPTPRARVPTLK